MKYSRSTILACLSVLAVNTNVAVLADEMDEFREFQEFKRAKVRAEGLGHANTFGGVGTEDLGTFSFDAQGREVTMFGAATDKFHRSVWQAWSKSYSIYEGIGNLKESIDDVQNSLNAPKKVYNAADDLCDALDSLEHILTAVGYIPGAKAIVAPVKFGVKRLKTPANKAKTYAKKLDSKTKPFMKKTQKVESKVNSLRSNISKVIKSEDNLYHKVEHSEKNYPQLGDERDAVTGTMTPVVDTFNGVQDQVHEVVQSTERDTESLRSALSAVSDLSDSIEEVTDTLGPVKDPLLELKRALDKQVCAPPFSTPCFSVGDVLNNPVLSYLNYLVDAVLDPILGSISIPGIPDGIPGLDKLDKLEQVLGNVERTLDNSIIYFSKTAEDVRVYDEKFQGFSRDIDNVRP